MAARKTSISLQHDDLNRFRKAADARGLSLSVFLKDCADAVLTPPDPRVELRAFAADLRADLREALAKVSEAGALNAERNRDANDEFRRQHDAFLHDLNSQQVEAVKKAIEYGRQFGIKQVKDASTKKTPEDFATPATPL